MTMAHIRSFDHGIHYEGSVNSSSLSFGWSCGETMARIMNHLPYHDCPYYHSSHSSPRIVLFILPESMTLRQHVVLCPSGSWGTSLWR